MGDHSAIEWTNASWNPIRGCSRVSEGCRNCYAERTAIRHVWMPTRPLGGVVKGMEPGAYHGLVKSTPSGPRWTGDVRFVEDALDLPLRWTKPRRIFVNSMSDMFHEKVEDYWQDQIFAVMALAQQHTFQILTKRPERMLTYLNDDDNVRGRIDMFMSEMAFERSDPDARRRDDLRATAPDLDETWPLPNVWLGVSVEDQATFDERTELLGRTPAAHRFLSMEPLLEEIDCGNALDWPPVDSPYGRIGWVIVGGESGPGARPCDLAWIRGVVTQANAGGVPVFVKQLGAFPIWDGCGLIANNPPGKTIKDVVGGQEVFRLLLRDRKGGDPAEWPEDLRVREYPQ